jgi:hypothetical protein
MFLFPFLYITSFIYSIQQLFKKQVEGVLVFMVIGLPIYINTMSVTFLYGFEKVIPILQSFKEVIVLATCIFLLFQIKNVKKIQLHQIDYLILLFFGYTLLYVFLPIGSYSIGSRAIAFKNLSFFPFLYFIGRFVDKQKLNMNKIFSFILITLLIACLVAMTEKFFYQHLHTLTGYSGFNAKFFQTEETGSYGLQWTFETENGLKRFGSIFSNPLEFAAATILGLTCLLALIVYKQKTIQLKPSNFQLLTLLASLICIFLAASRASFISYFFILYCFAIITNQKKYLYYLYTAIFFVFIYVFFWLEGDMYEFIINTITFQNSSSIGHVVEWLDGVNAMIESPLGKGLGESGRVAIEQKENIGGENQFIIIGVQAGVIAMLIYLVIYIQLIRQGLKNMRLLAGQDWKICLSVVLIKLGLFIPLFTANVESYIYISYFTWFLSGLMVNIIQSSNAQISKSDA